MWICIERREENAEPRKLFGLELDGLVFISSFHWNDCLCNREASVVRLSVRKSVCLSVCKLLHTSRYFYHTHDSIAIKLAHDGPHMGLHPGCAQGQGQGQRSRDTGTSVMSRNVCYTVPSDVLSLPDYMHSLYEAPLHSPSSQTARCNVYIME